MINGKNKVANIMVVGAGIGGCNAALNLANSGFKVYLLEKNPCKFMIQLDKPFPIEDCSKCILASKLKEIGEYPNIELITNVDILSLEGKPGNFNVVINKGVKNSLNENCIRILSDNKNEDFQLSQIKSLKVLIESRRIPPCENACPAHVRSQEYIDLISKGKYKESLDLIRERCPIPSVIGRICNHPCEDVCNRGKVDEPINICGLKKFVADYVRENIEEKIEFLENKKQKKIAIVGSGPSGLTVAYHLARRGYLITIFERESVVGGMLRLGIPDYRLPPEIINSDIDHIKKYGVEIKTNTQIGPPGPTIKDLLKEYNAVYIGVGLPKSRRLNIEKEDLENVIHGIDFLKNCNLGKKVSVGKIVLVIGGGDVAIDVARSALRKGAKEVHQIMLESEDIIPAQTWEVEEAKEEGIIFHTSRGPKKFVGKDGKVTGLETLYCSSVFDKKGRFNPVLEAGTEEIIEGDMAIVTIGQTSDLEFLDSEIKVGRGIEIDKNFQTSMLGVFAGGEIATGPGSAINAIAIGNKVAIVIDKYLKGEDISKLVDIIPDYNDDDIVEIEDIKELERIQHKPRINTELISPEERKKNFNEITIKMDENMALEESKRCLSCGICNECFECIKECRGNSIEHEKTDEIISINIKSIILSSSDAWLLCYDLRKRTQYRWKIVSPIAVIEEDKCIGCGKCREICEFDAIEKVETLVEFMAIRDSAYPSISLTKYKSRILPDLCKGCGDCIGICPVGAISLKLLTEQNLVFTIKLYNK